MSEPFQDFTHRKSTYDRPNRNWTCGGACDGCPCLLGPSPRGQCQAGAPFDGRVSGECLPARQGDLWVCNRVDTHGGSPCEEGPLPDGSCCRPVPKCQPRPTLRRLRGHCVLLACLATVGLLVVLLSPGSGTGSAPPAAISPGPLSFSHAFLEMDCASCHSAPDLTPARLATFNPHGFDARAMNDGRLCLKCHTEIGENQGEFAFHPHSASPATLPKPTTPSAPGKADLLLAAATPVAAGLREGQAACSTCHTEHRGETFDLKTLSDNQCQVCHQTQFKSFEHGHPEFDEIRYPHDRRTRIHFDHYSHYQKHFPETLKSKPDAVPSGFESAFAKDRAHLESESCTTCHSPATDSGQMKVNAFENACAQCHTKNVFSTTSWPIVAIPPINLGALNTYLREPEGDAPPSSLGTWFQTYEASGDFPWPMVHFLDPETRAKWTQLADAGLSLSDLAGATPAQMQLAADVFWGFKELLVDVSEGNPEGKRGSAELARRLAANGFENTTAMITGFPQDAFLRFQETLGPDEWRKLKAEVLNYRAGTPPPPESDTTETDALPSGEEPEPDTTPPSDAPESFDAPDDTEESFGDPSDAPEKSFDAPADADTDREESFDSPADADNTTEESFDTPEPTDTTEESFGAPEPADATEESFDTPEPADTAEESFDAPEPSDTAGNEEESFDSPEGGSETETLPEEVELERPNPDVWTENTGGWFESVGSIVYKSTGHADPLLKSWIEAMVGRIEDPAAIATVRESLKFASGVESRAAGNCLMCHTIDERRDASGKVTGATVNWLSQAKAPDPTPGRALTRFNHKAHLLLADCRKCHTTETGEPARDGYAASFPSEGSWNEESGWFDKANPHVFQSNFRQIEKATCATCHNGNTADNSCLHCHQYHLPVTDAKQPIIDRILKRK